MRSYITHLNKKALSIDEVDDKRLVATFTNGLRKGKFLFSLYKNNPKTMSEVLYRATKYMNAKDTLLVHEDKPKKGKGKRTQDRIEGAKWLGPEIDRMIDASNPPLGDSQASPR